MGPLDRQLQPFVGHHNSASLALAFQLQILACPLKLLMEGTIIVGGLMMEKNQGLDIGTKGYVNRRKGRAVSPVFFSDGLSDRVLGIKYCNLCLGKEGDEFFLIGSRKVVEAGPRSCGSARRSRSRQRSNRPSMRVKGT